LNGAPSAPRDDADAAVDVDDDNDDEDHSSPRRGYLTSRLIGSINDRSTLMEDTRRLGVLRSADDDDDNDDDDPSRVRLSTIFLAEPRREGEGVRRRRGVICNFFLSFPSSREERTPPPSRDGCPE
jgi:hypothetical protein